MVDIYEQVHTTHNLFIPPTNTLYLTGIKYIKQKLLEHKPLFAYHMCLRVFVIVTW